MDMLTICSKASLVQLLIETGKSRATNVLVKVDATVGKLSEGSLLLQLCDARRVSPLSHLPAPL